MTGEMKAKEEVGSRNVSLHAIQAQHRLTRKDLVVLRRLGSWLDSPVDR